MNRPSPRRRAALARRSRSLRGFMPSVQALENRQLLATVIDNGGPGFSETPGNWAFFGNQGYNGNIDEAPPGDGSAKTDWAFAGLAPGRYLVSTTWSVDLNRATDAPYTMYDGMTRITGVAVDQRQQPVGSADTSGGNWIDLGTFEVDSGTLRVELSNLADGRVEADAVRIEPARQSPPSAAPVVIDNGTSLTQTSGNWTLFGNQGYNGNIDEALPGDGSAKTDWIFADLVPGRYLVSTTWTKDDNRASNAPYTIYDGTASMGGVAVNQRQAPAGSADTSGGAWYDLGTFEADSGTLRVELSNLADGRVEADAVRIKMVAMTDPSSPPRIIDSGSGFGQTPGDWTFFGDQGYHGTISEALPGDGSAKSDWTFASLAPGRYLVSTTWSTYQNRATDAPYTIYDGMTRVTGVAVDQRQQPIGSADPSGMSWLDLGTFEVDSGTLRVELSNLADGRVEADAVRVEMVTATPPPPSAPTGLTATPGPGQIALSWSPASGAAGYSVERSADGTTGWAEIGSPTAAAYADLASGTTYSYRVRAANAGGYSPYSAPASGAATIPPSIPVVTIVATQPSASELGGVSGEFQINRTGSTKDPIIVS